MKVIGVNVDGISEWHAVHVGSGDYATLCGLDGNDPTVGQFGIIVPNPWQKISCPQCYAIVKGILDAKFKEADFSDEARK